MKKQLSLLLLLLASGNTLFSLIAEDFEKIVKQNRKESLLKTRIKMGVAFGVGAYLAYRYPEFFKPPMRRVDAIKDGIIDDASNYYDQSIKPKIKNKLEQIKVNTITTLLAFRASAENFFENSFLLSEEVQPSPFTTDALLETQNEHEQSDNQPAE